MKKILFLLVVGFSFIYCGPPKETDQTTKSSSTTATSDTGTTPSTGDTGSKRTDTLPH